MTYNVFSGTLNPTHFTSLPRLSCGVACDPTFSRFSRTHNLWQMDGQTDTWRQLTPALASVEQVKTYANLPKRLSSRKVEEEKW